VLLLIENLKSAFFGETEPFIPLKIVIKTIMKHLVHLFDYIFVVSAKEILSKNSTTF